MSTSHPLFLTTLLSLGLGLTGVAASADVGHEGGPSQSPSTPDYRGRLKMSDTLNGECRFEISLERIPFLLNTVQGKYKAVKITASNASPTEIRLSSDTDTIQLVLNNGDRVDGILNLREKDKHLWDSLDAETRDGLLYPKVIGPAAGTADAKNVSPMIVEFFAFFPASQIHDLPDGFEYKIKSFPEPVLINSKDETMVRTLD